GRLEGVQGALRDLADASQARKLVTIHVKTGVLTGALVDTQGAEPALALAIRAARPDIVRAVLQAGIDPNKPLGWRTPYWFDPWTKDKWPKRWGLSHNSPTALDLALLNTRITFNRRGGNVMVSNPTVVRDAVEDHLMTPNVDVVRALVQYGAIVEDRHLEAARKLSDAEILEVLSDAKANPVKMAKTAPVVVVPGSTSRIIAANMRDHSDYAVAAETNGTTRNGTGSTSLTRSSSISGNGPSSSTSTSLTRTLSVNGGSSSNISAPPAQHPLTPRVPVPTNTPSFQAGPLHLVPPVTSISSTDPDFLQRSLRDALATISRLRAELDAFRDQNQMLTAMLRERDEAEARRRKGMSQVVHDVIGDQRRSDESNGGTSPVEGRGSGRGMFPFPGAQSHSIAKASAPFATGATASMTTGIVGGEKKGWGTPGTPVNRK
ncbi:hypothetical protein HDU93_009412, partial [Gonapodya sp. JEL0774]